MERAKRTAHVVANSASTDLPSSSSPPKFPANDIATNATAASHSLGKHWSIEKVLTTIPHPPPPNPTSPLPYLHILERLKTTPREGWRRFRIPTSESIADHMYRMSILTLLCPLPLRSTLDIPRCTLLALCHDMGESLVGDLTPVDNIPKAEKSRRERETMGYLTGTLLGRGTGCADAGTLIREAWEEYEDNVTLEARFVHDVDKLELVIQMVEYERRGQGKLDLWEFSWVAERIEMVEMQEWCREVLSEREEFWKGLGKVPSGADSAAKSSGTEDGTRSVDGQASIAGEEQGR